MQDPPWHAIDVAPPVHGLVRPLAQKQLPLTAALAHYLECRLPGPCSASIFEQVACRRNRARERGRIARSHRKRPVSAGLCTQGALLVRTRSPGSGGARRDARMLVAARPSQPASCQPNRSYRPCRHSLVDTNSASSSRAMTPRSPHRAHRQRLARLAVRPAARAKSNEHGRNLLPMTNYLV